MAEVRAERSVHNETATLRIDTCTLEIAGAPDDLQRLLKAVETAGHRSQQNRRPRSTERNEARYVGGD